jgi:hypothetical protein
MKLNVIQKGTHEIMLKDLNNDVPSPCECVADSLYQVKYYLGELVKNGGCPNDSLLVANLNASIFELNASLVAAARQNWKLELK